MKNGPVIDLQKGCDDMKINTHIGSVDIKVDTKRIDKNLRKAQKALNMAVENDCNPLVPHLHGDLRRSFRYGNGDVYSDYVEYNSPYAHYQYVGYLRTDENGRVIVGHREEKPVLTDTPLEHHEPGTTDHWFEKAKELHHDDWIKLVKDEVGKN